VRLTDENKEVMEKLQKSQIAEKDMRIGLETAIARSSGLEVSALFS
jgi:hypothetical protein